MPEPTEFPSLTSILINALKQQVYAVQLYARLCGQVFASLLSPPLYWTDILDQMDLIGVGSLPIVVITSFFIGGVLVLQTELGPAITALLVAGRNASGIASELGSMVVTEQVDAMRALGTDPVRKLVTPRVVAMTLMLPLLVAVADFVGLIGGFIVSYFTLHLGPVQFWTRAVNALEFGDLMQGMLKPVAFAIIISTVGCFQGLGVRGGTQGVGRATTTAVVISSVYTLVVDFFLARLLLFIFHK